jgi:hypothetical protein
MNHRHLVIAYAVTWIIQLSYAGFLAGKWFSLRRAERQFPTYREDGD